MNIVSELLKVATQAKELDSSMSDGLGKLAKKIESDEMLKEAKLINDGDVVICVDNFATLFKGRRYKVSDSSIPGYLAISEIDGGDVGVFAINRFVLDNNEQ